MIRHSTIIIYKIKNKENITFIKVDMNKTKLLEIINNIATKQRNRQHSDDDYTDDSLNEEESNTIRKCIHHAQIESEQLYGTYQHKSLQILATCLMIGVINIFL